MKQLEKLVVAVIDDESISQKQICRLLSRNGYQSEGFENPLLFLERMEVILFILF
jgi:FixJ family two-component response regulator